MNKLKLREDIRLCVSQICVLLALASFFVAIVFLFLKLMTYMALSVVVTYIFAQLVNKLGGPPNRLI